MDSASRLSLPRLFSSRTVFLCFRHFLVSVLFSGPSLLGLNFYRKTLTPSRSKPLATCILMQSIAPEFYDFSSQLRKLNAKISILFFFLSFFFSIKHNSKVYSVYKRSTHQMNALLSKIFLFLDRAGCELRSTSMVQNTHCGGFSVCHFVRNYTHNSKTKGGIKTFYLSNDCFNIRDIYSLG